MDLYKDSDIETLLQRCREHDDDAFDQLVTRYTPMMRKVICSFGQVSYDFGELFSEACVALHTATQRFDLDQSEVTFGLYARICVRNRIVDLLRISEGDRTITDRDVEQMAEEDNLEGRIAERETFERILASAKLLLSDYEYRVLLLHIQGYNTSTIAEMLSRTPKSVDNAKFRLFRRLRADIGDVSKI